MPTMITTGRTIPAPYLPRPAGRHATSAGTSPSTSGIKATKPGDKVNRKPPFNLNLASYDWRTEVLLSAGSSAAGQPRSLPANSSKGVMMVPRDAIRPRSVNKDESKMRGEEVGLEDLIEEGKGRREKRATTATALGFDFVPNPSVTALPDEVGLDAAGPARAAAKATATLANLAATPETPGLLPQKDDGGVDEEDDDDDGWERISAYHDDDPDGLAKAGDDEVDDDDDLIVLGELELEDPAEVVPPGKQDGQKAAGKVSYAAALGKAA